MWRAGEWWIFFPLLTADSNTAHDDFPICTVLFVLHLAVLLSSTAAVTVSFSLLYVERLSFLRYYSRELRT